MTTTRMSKTREKIVEAASDLFYRQGYQATVVNQIVEQAGVSKPTFYAHFPSKEELCLSYLSARRDESVRVMMDALSQQKELHARFMVPIRVLRDVMTKSDYRGCSHYNMLIEIADNDSVVAKEVRKFKDMLRKLMIEITRELLESDSRYSHLNPSYVADAYYLIFCGAVMFSQEYHATWPLELAETQVEALLR